MSSVKKIPIGTLTATTGGNLTVYAGDFTFPTAPTDYFQTYRISGSASLSSDQTVVVSGTPEANTYIRIINDASYTLSGNSLVIMGVNIPDEIAITKFIADCYYDGSKWTVVVMPTFGTSAILGTSTIATKAITQSKIDDDAVGLAQLDQNTAGGILYWNTSTDPAILDLSTDGMIPIGDATGTVAGYVMSGDATMTKGGVVTVPAVKLQDSLYSQSATTAVTTEETLWSHALGTGLLSTDGMGVKVEVFGTCASNTNTKTIRLKADGNTIVSNGTTTAPNGLNWEAEMTILRSGATSSVAKGMIAFDGVADEVDTSKPGITWTNNITLSITGQNGTAAANDIVVELVVCTLLY